MLPTLQLLPRLEITSKTMFFVAPFACQESGQAPQHQCILQMAAKPLEPAVSVNRWKSGANIKSIENIIDHLHDSRNLDQTPISSFSDLGSLICAKEDFRPDVARYRLWWKNMPYRHDPACESQNSQPWLRFFQQYLLGFLRNRASRALSFWSLAMGSLTSMHCE